MYHHKLYLLLVILVVSCHAAFEETSRFLTDNGFGHVSQQFVEEEIEVRQIPSLPKVAKEEKLAMSEMMPRLLQDSTSSA